MRSGFLVIFESYVHRAKQKYFSACVFSLQSTSYFIKNVNIAKMILGKKMLLMNDPSYYRSDVAFTASHTDKCQSTCLHLSIFFSLSFVVMLILGLDF